MKKKMKIAKNYKFDLKLKKFGGNRHTLCILGNVKNN